MSVGTEESRLWGLIEQRCSEIESKAEIDEKIWELYGETWAIMFTDLSGFSKKTETFGIIHFLQTIYQHKKIVSPIIDSYNGFLLKSEGDSLLVIFRKAQDSLDCAIDMQRACQRFNVGQPKENEILLCIGLGYGEVLRFGDDEVFGAQVNAASKLGEDTAKCHEILVTGALADECGGRASTFFSAQEHTIPGAQCTFILDYSKED